ncbi:MAG: UDP-glycosyltransferase [Flavobacteriales bacterium]|nr:UDP-glycosyltransferase [Flavobacteriales bacterium]
MKKKVFVFFPDGVGLRNFAFTNFKEIGEKRGYDIHYWNNTIFSIEKELGYQEVKLESQSIHPLTPIYSRARKHIELNISRDKFNDDVYPTYKFPFSFKGLKESFKSLFTLLLIGLNSSEKGLERIINRIDKLERKNPKYAYCKAQLIEHKPDLIFCTTQRATQAISAILAAKDLGIPTVSFVYSWDNVPKAMMTIEADYYVVWSNLMKNELIKYYPKTKDNQVFVSGTPQFEPHFDKSLIEPKEVFFKKYGLDFNKKYICFSGDDETTSPLDQYYLEDVANAVRELNTQGYNLSIIYRKCPVDFTNRYDAVVEKNKDIIVSIDPLWKQVGAVWNQIMPTKEDFSLLANVCHHTEFVTNVCSSTVFDFVIHKKPTIYFNYEQPQLKKGIRDIGQNYKYVHFRSMPDDNTVVWAKKKEELKDKIQGILDQKLNSVPTTEKWLEVIVQHPIQNSSERIWDSLSAVMERRNK